MTNDKVTIAGYIPRGIKSSVKEIAEEELRMTVTQFVNDAVYTYLDRHTDVDLTDNYPELENVIKNSDLYRRESIKNYYNQQEHNVVKNNLKALTFFDYVDKNLSNVYLKLKSDHSREEIEEIMKQHLQVYKNRVETYNEDYDVIDFKQQYKYRLKDPVAYAETYLDSITDVEELRREQNM